MHLFKNPETGSDSEGLDEMVENLEDLEGAALIAPEINFEDIDSDSDLEPTDDDAMPDAPIDGTDSTEFDSEKTDSDDSAMSDAEASTTAGKKPQENASAADDARPSGSGGSRSARNGGEAGFESNVVADNADDDEEEEDETVRAIMAAIKKPRESPPEIKATDFVTDICFHPERDIIALATIEGDVSLYEYSNEENKLLRTIEVHAKVCRDVEFTSDGRDLLTCSKDKTIMVTDMETEKLKKFYESAHDSAINKLYVIDENLFSTGDDDGVVKLWDLRTKEPIFALKEVEDYITQMITNDAKKLLVITSADGYLTTLNIGARKLYVQSEPYQEEPTCMGLYRGDSKLVVGTAKGSLYTYNWGQFGYHCDMFPGVKSNISAMIPITDRIACVAGEEGVIRACHIAPFRNLGIVGQHGMPVECMDVNSSGELIASWSHNNDVRFWNVKYFEDFADIKYNEKHNQFKEKRHNLPSSKFANASDFFADLAKPAEEKE